MRTILLTCPTEPQQLPNICREQIPLSENGVALANTLFESAIFREADIVYVSPCRRAYDTAVLQGKAVQTDERLIERPAVQYGHSGRKDTHSLRFCSAV